jgi:hypothetical protein
MKEERKGGNKSLILGILRLNRKDTARRERRRRGG